MSLDHNREQECDENQLNDPTNETTISQIISNSQEYGIEAVYYPEISINELKFLSQEWNINEELLEKQGLQEFADAKDIFNEFPTNLLFKSCPFTKDNTSCLIMGKDPNLMYKWMDHRRLCCSGKIKFYLNSRMVKVVFPHSKPIWAHKNQMILQNKFKNRKFPVSDINNEKNNEMSFWSCCWES